MSVLELFGISLSSLWLILLVVFALAEAATVTLVSIWFAAGALVALLVSLFTDNLVVQIILFLVVSALCMALVRPLTRKYFTARASATNLDRLIGTDAVVTETIDNLAATGQIKASGQVWTARSENGERIFAGEQVSILRIEGVKLIVAPVKTAASVYHK